jgi:hypothetical protein
MSDDEGENASVKLFTEGIDETVEFDPSDQTVRVPCPTRLVMVAPQSVVLGEAQCKGVDSEALDIVSLPHPRHKGDSLFAVVAGGRDDDRLFEIQEHRRRFATTWFLGEDHVEPTSGLFLVTPFDHTFFAVALARAAPADRQQESSCFVSADEILRRSEAAERVLPPAVKASIARALSCVCEIKTAAGEHYFRYSQQKFVAWASAKHKKLAQSEELREALKSSDPSLLGTVALELIAEYVDAGLRPELAAACGVAMAAPEAHLLSKPAGESRSAARDAVEPLAKKAKVEPLKPLAIRRLEKGGPPKGTPTLMAMFAKKQDQQKQQQQMNSSN